MQAVLEIPQLPQGPLDANATFVHSHLETARRMLAQTDTAALAIVLPAAGPGHDDWRCALARDMARAHAPRRVNVVGAGGMDQARPLLAYLGDAPGVTGQYLAAHG